MENKKIRIVMADDHKMITRSLAEVINQYQGLQVVGIVEDGNKLLQYLNGHHTEVDVVILDLHMPEVDGLMIVPIINSRFPHIKTIILSMYFSPQILEKVKAAGADMFIHKADDIEVLISRIREVVENKKHFPLYKSSNEYYTNEITEDAYMKIAVLTEREKQIARLIREGLSTPKMAAKLHLSEYTVNTHRKNILKKLNLKTTGDLIRFATENRL